MYVCASASRSKESPLMVLPLSGVTCHNREVVSFCTPILFVLALSVCYSSNAWCFLVENASNAAPQVLIVGLGASMSTALVHSSVSEMFVALRQLGSLNIRLGRLPVLDSGIQCEFYHLAQVRHHELNSFTNMLPSSAQDENRRRQLEM